MGLILSEPMKKVVEIPKILANFSVEDAKNHEKRPYRLRTSPGRKGRKKTIGSVFSQQKLFFEKVLCFCLPWAQVSFQQMQDRGLYQAPGAMGGRAKSRGAVKKK
jgi:hypothetical protein